jgi:putative serine protease PepD
MIGRLEGSEGWGTENNLLSFQPSFFENKGAFVGKVRPGSPAQRVGLRKGDVITEIGSQSIPDAATLVDLSKQITPGQEVRGQFVRGGRMQETAVAF